MDLMWRELYLSHSVDNCFKSLTLTQIFMTLKIVTHVMDLMKLFFFLITKSMAVY